MSLALRLRGVHKAYGKVRALDGLDLDVPRGAAVGLVGPNGAGKTTTFGVLGGLVRPDAGEIDILGGGAFDPGAHRGRVLLLPQDSELNPHTPVRTLLVNLARLQGMTRGEAGRAADGVLDEVELRERGGFRVGQLSHGMRRRVAVAQALLGSPEIVLLDEPTSGLDPALVVRMRDVVRRRRGAITLVISSHVLSELEAVCDHVAFLEKGRCVRQGPMDEVTGRTRRVHILLAAAPDATAVAGALPGLRPRIDGASLHLLVPEGETVASLNRRVLPGLISAGIDVLEVTLGDGLEAAWMEGRGDEAETSA
jgi:ABC-2 type transport system ATP-binding protein